MLNLTESQKDGIANFYWEAATVFALLLLCLLIADGFIMLN